MTWWQLKGATQAGICEQHSGPAPHGWRNDGRKIRDSRRDGANKQGADMTARQLTQEEIAKGYEICPCGKYAHAFRASALDRLPKGYLGELCPKCGLLMIAIDKLEEKNA